MSVLTLHVDEVMRTLSSDGQYPFVVNDKTVDIVRFALNTGFTDVVLDEYSALRVMYQRPGETEVRAQTLTYYDTDGIHNFYDWELLAADLAEKGALTVALCILRVEDGDVEEWHTTPCQVRVLDSIHTDDSDEADETVTPTVAQRVAVLETMIQRVASGAPIVVASTSAMTDTEQIYVLSTDGMWYYYNGSAWTAGGEYGAVATDTTLTQPGIPADGKTVGDIFGTVDARLTALENSPGGGVPPSVKQSLITLLKAGVYAETGLTDEIAAIEAWASSAPELLSISASYTGGTVRAGASLDSLRNDLAVTATYQDHTTEAVTGYTLSGILAEGTRTVTVSYGGKTATFTVTVVSGSTPLYSWDFTQGLTDSVGSKTANATATQDSTGLHFTASQKYIEFPTVYAKDRTYEIDVSSILKSSPNTYGRLFVIDHDSVTGTGGAGYVLTGTQKGGDLCYIESWDGNIIVSQASDPNGSYYDGSTVGFYIDTTGKIHVYKDGTKLGASSNALSASYDGANVYIGSSGNNDALYNAAFTGFRVYDGNKYGGV